MQLEKFPLLLINPDRHDIPFPDRGEKSSGEHDGESNSPFLAAQLTFKTHLETKKNKLYACTSLICESC